MKKSFIIPVIILAVIGGTFFYGYSKINAMKQEHIRKREELRLARQNAILERSKEEQKISQEKKFDKKYIVIYEEDISSPQVKKYAQHVYIPLGLSKEILRVNLEHAAKTLKRAKNADSVFIFAYRIDDRKHESGYTAGRYVIASNTPDTFDIAEVYTKTKKIYPAATEAVINKDNVNLYSRYDFEPSDVVAKLKAGTEVMLLEHVRDFAMTDIIDIYKVLVWPHKNKKSQSTGWIMDNDINFNLKQKGKEKIKTSEINTQKIKITSTPIQIQKKIQNQKYKLTQAEQQEIDKVGELVSSFMLKKLDTEKTLSLWKNSGQESKIATCGVYLSFAFAEGYLNIQTRTKIRTANGLYRHAKMVADKIDSIISQLNLVDSQLNQDKIGDTIIFVMKNYFNWLQ